MKHRSIVYVTVSAILLAWGGAWARPTTPHEAQMAVTGWLKADPQPLGTAVGRRVLEVRTFAGDDGRPAYHIVYLQPSGFVIVSADDLVEPIIGFADDGVYDPSLDNPVGALVTNDLNGRVRAVRNTFGLQTEMWADGARGPRGKWRHFIDLAENSTGGFGLMALMSPGDIRVIPLLQSRWGQSTACGEYCYNYYTPSYYPAGCLATAMAQVMRYYEYPSDPIGVQQFSIEVGDVTAEQKAYTLGGDGLGGPYNWSAMPLKPEAACTTLTEIQRQAIGALCYDAGIAVEMTYEPSGSGAFLPEARDALVETFLYSSAILGYDPGGNVHSGLREMINPSLDAKAPVILAISDLSDPNSGHAVVCDGYGYLSSTLYHHLNMGWQGVDDAWYNLPDIDSLQDRFNVIFGCIYNISTSGAGEIISGRVLAPEGRPIVNAKVFAEPGSRVPRPALTDDRGVYALEGLASSTTYRIRVEADGYVFVSQSVKTGSSQNSFARSGNRSGIDFYAQSAKNPPTSTLIYVKVDAPQDPGPHDSAISDPDEDGTVKHPFDAIQEAIDAAISGDIVVVLQGTCAGDGNRDLDFRGKAITIRGEDPNDPNLVIIDCGGTAENPHRGFEFHRYEAPASVLDGLTITGGYHERGGAIYCGDGARPTVANCVFRDNSAALGGGIFNDSSPKIVDCTFVANSADAGGGMYNDGEASECNPVLVNCTFYANSASHNGAGMYNLGQRAAPTLVRCTFAENSVSAGGGGAIRNNLGGTVTLSNCLVTGNSAATFGGAIRHSNGGSTTLTNCTFAANSASLGNAFASTPDDSGSQAPCVLQVLNCILWDGGGEMLNDDNSILNVTYSNVQGGSPRGPWPGQGNIDADPHFADPDHGDYHLKSTAGHWDSANQSWVFDAATSPCIDAGDTSTPVGPEPPPNGGIVNMGAYGGTAQASKSDFSS
ncbi:MAG: C10 family peptidase [Phycisphaerales bacterium]|nr:MAG: C10 family peptidase [Phycisphaerales bacterium]